LLYVVDRGGNRIYQLTLDGTLTLIAGSGVRGHADGGRTEASFSLPNDLAVSPDGSLLYVNEVAPLTGSAIGPTTIRVIKLPRN
jgi:sugar lactone lactonase YvrE